MQIRSDTFLIRNLRFAHLAAGLVGAAWLGWAAWHLSAQPLLTLPGLAFNGAVFSLIALALMLGFKLPSDEAGEASLIRTALKHAPVSLYTNDRDLRYTWIFNAGMGFKAEQVIGKRDDELLPLRYVAELIALKRRVLASGVGESQRISVDMGAERKIFHVTAAPLMDTADSISGLTVSVIDITNYVRSEWVLQERSKRLALATQAAQLGIFEWDVSKNTALWENEAMYQIFGHTRAEGAVSHKQFTEEYLHPDDLHSFD